MNGIIGKKIGMTSVFDEDGRNIPCTIVEAGPCVVTQKKTEDTDGYDALQLGFGEKKAKNTSKALQGHFDKAGTAPKRKVVEFRDFEINKEAGDIVTAADVFEEGDLINAIGTSKGKGFQGVVKRYNFKVGYSPERINPGDKTRNLMDGFYCNEVIL